jgi:(1->4)-alpha-D-glucan 1-alpha-D-glucosylmutase
MIRRDHRPHTPVATYRVQLTRNFGFGRAAELVDYLDELGVDTLYASPILAARPNSTSGYDVVDPRCLNSELGSRDQLDALADQLTLRRMGMVLDIVPNHMAATSDNPLWADVLARGQASEHAPVFDIDWSAGPALPGEDARITLPVLGAPYAEVLARGELSLGEQDGAPCVRYFEHTWPLAEGTVAADTSALPSDPDAIDAVLDRQFYQLGYWRVSAQRVNYRRFFDISDLVGVRVHDPEVFDLIHGLILALVRRGVVTGLRVDHIDGLRDPHEYLHWLRQALPTTDDDVGFYVVVEKILSVHEALRKGWPVQGTTGYEYVRALNGVFVDARGLAALERNYARFLGFKQPFSERLYQQKKRVIQELFPGELRRRSAELLRLAARDPRARDIVDHDLEQALLEVMACFPVYRTYVRELGEVHPDDRRQIATAVIEARQRNVLVPDTAYDFIERVLTVDAPERLSQPHRRAWLEFVLRWQQLTGPIMAKGLEDTALYQDFRLLSLNSVGGEPDPEPESLNLDAFHAHNLVQQASWPLGLVATSTHDSKRSEDVRARLHVLSDRPTLWSRALSRWSGYNRRHEQVVNQVRVPSRNEEVLIYQSLLGAWPLTEAEQGEFVERFIGYVIKASREGKQRTSWIDTNEAYEQALVRFVRAILDPDASPEFLADFLAFQRRLAFYGAINSLSQVVLKVTSPGVPDFYQGTELWTLTLVDPDNRRPVDFALRRGLLAELQGRSQAPHELCRELLSSWQDGRIKLHVTHRALHFRRAHRELFLQGAYVPVQVEGARADSVCAYARQHSPLAGEQGEDTWCLTVVPMRVGRLTSPGTWPVGKRTWKGTLLRLPPGAPGHWRDIITGSVVRVDSAGMLPMASVLRTLPVAILQAGATNRGKHSPNPRSSL